MQLLTPLLTFTGCAIIMTFIPSHVQADQYDPIIKEIEAAVQQEMEEWGITGISVALVDDQKTVYAKGFGIADQNSIFRAGSISKLFNAVAVMQLVEAGKLDLDAPLPAEVLPHNPFPDQPKITLRQLLSHRSGLQRETNVGGYLDSTEPGIANTVKSLTNGVLVTRPTEMTRYSNIGPTVAGHMIERVLKIDFPAYQQKNILGKLNMKDSAWLRKNLPEGRLIKSYINIADGRGGWHRKETPVFDLGTIPAGNLFTTVNDLGRFASALIKANPDGQTPKSMLEKMWEPQFTDSKTGFGLGFFVGNRHGHRTVQHSGAVYGHSSSFVVFPELKIAVIVMGNEDIANGRISAISDRAIDQFIKLKTGQKVASEHSDVKADTLKPFTGDFESESYWAKLEIKNGQLVGNISGQHTTFKPVGDMSFIANSRITNNATAHFIKMDDHITGFTMSGQTYGRVKNNPPPLSPHWRKVLGKYGDPLIPLIITERHGHLYVMTENMVDYRLVPVNQHVCALPPGMYIKEHVVFLPDEDGYIHTIDYANMIFKRTK